MTTASPIPSGGLPRLHQLKYYPRTYSRLVNYSDLNSAEHLDGAVICRFVLDTLMQFWMELFELPLNSNTDVTQWLARCSGYEPRGVRRVVMANLEQRVRFVAEGFRLETIHTSVAIKQITRTGAITALRLFVVRPNPKRPGLTTEVTVALVETHCILVDADSHRALPVTPELRSYLIRGLSNPGSPDEVAALNRKPVHMTPNAGNPLQSRL